jgi:hypothetical protein
MHWRERSTVQAAMSTEEESVFGNDQQEGAVTN